jgi:hypothetical protein
MVHSHTKQKTAKLFQMAYKIVEKNESFDFKSAVTFKELNGVNMVDMGRIVCCIKHEQTERQFN